MERGETPHREFAMSVVSLGTEWGLVALSGKVFSAYELGINAFGRFTHSMVLAHGDETVGYIPTGTSLPLGKQTPIVAEVACIETESFPGFFDGAAVATDRGLHRATAWFQLPQITVANRLANRSSAGLMSCGSRWMFSRLKASWLASAALSAWSSSPSLWTSNPQPPPSRSGSR